MMKQSSWVIALVAVGAVACTSAPMDEGATPEADEAAVLGDDSAAAAAVACACGTDKTGQYCGVFRQSDGAAVVYSVRTQQDPNCTAACRSEAYRQAYATYCSAGGGAATSCTCGADGTAKYCGVFRRSDGKAVVYSVRTQQDPSCTAACSSDAYQRAAAAYCR